MSQKKEGVVTNGQDVVMNVSALFLCKVIKRYIFFHRTLMAYKNPWPRSLFFDVNTDIKNEERCFENLVRDCSIVVLSEFLSATQCLVEVDYTLYFLKLVSGL